MEQKRLPIFSERFSQLRGDKTQGEFADFLGISRPTVGFYENGTRIPDALVLRQIAGKCRVSADWLLGLTDVKTHLSTVRYICENTGLTELAVERLGQLYRAGMMEHFNIMMEGLNVIAALHQTKELENFVIDIPCDKYVAVISISDLDQLKSGGELASRIVARPVVDRNFILEAKERLDKCIDDIAEHIYKNNVGGGKNG